MLIVAGVFQVDPDRRDEFIRGRAPAMEASRAEPGCLEYVFAPDPIVPGRVVLLERWTDEASLADHIAALRLARKDAAPSADEVPVLSSEILKYEVGAVAPLG
ncbi:MAG: antibiotic biosynthesis monooxygenase [Ilumatobacteraceae bacterium]